MCKACRPKQQGRPHLALRILASQHHHGLLCDKRLCPSEYAIAHQPDIALGAVGFTRSLLHGNFTCVECVLFGHADLLMALNNC